MLRERCSIGKPGETGGLIGDAVAGEAGELDDDEWFGDAGRKSARLTLEPVRLSMRSGPSDSDFPSKFPLEVVRFRPPLVSGPLEF